MCNKNKKNIKCKIITFEEYMKINGMTKKDYYLRKKWFNLGWNTLEKKIKTEMRKLKTSYKNG